jgi:hypothetical protein
MLQTYHYTCKQHSYFFRYSLFLLEKKSRIYETVKKTATLSVRSLYRRNGKWSPSRKVTVLD